MKDNYTNINSKTIDRWVEEGWKWGQPIDLKTYEEAVKGNWDVVLTPTKPMPHNWFPSSIEGLKILGLASGGAQVFNAFIMPFNRIKNKFSITNWYGNVAEAIGDWITTPEIYERIQGIVIDTRYLLRNYDGNHDYDKELLSVEIEKVLIE